MCGILGIINLYNKKKINENTFSRMLTSMSHRGPDDYGMYKNNDVYLGHRRLSILDLSVHGKQPMKSLNADVWIIHNGEIYNFLEIKKDLISKGYKFKSNTDTEVIVNAYIEYGNEFIKKLNGMFSFAIYDMRNNNSKVLIYRDRLGIKPLYYSEFDGKFIFSSEIKAILLYPNFQRNVNNLGLSSYLSYRYPIKYLTLFENINTLEPGYGIEINIKEKRFNIFKYWDLKIKHCKHFGEDYYINNVKKLLKRSVKYRMISDVPLGAYLSGGLDSSVIVANMAELNDFPIKTFTIGFKEEGFNEFKYAREVANLYKTEHHEILLSGEDYLEEMFNLIDYKDAPLGVANEPALYVMSKELKKYITVVLSGEGSDEIFGGYGRIFRSPYDYMRIKLLTNNKYKYLNDEIVISLMTENLNKKYNNLSFKDEVQFFLNLYQYISLEDKSKFLSGDFLKDINFDYDLNIMFYDTFNEVKHKDLYTKFMYIFEKIHIVGLLQRVDVTTMAASVEARVPFVDHKLVEFAFKIPVKYKLKWKSKLHEMAASIYNADQISENYDIPKYILKKSFEKKLPQNVIYRKKMGFPVPVHKWFGDKFFNFTKDILLSKKAKERGIYNIKFLEKLLYTQEIKENHKIGLKIWMLLNLELWFRKYIDDLDTKWNI